MRDFVVVESIARPGAREFLRSAFNRCTPTLVWVALTLGVLSGLVIGVFLIIKVGAEPRAIVAATAQRVAEGLVVALSVLAAVLIAEEWVARTGIRRYLAYSICVGIASIPAGMIAGALVVQVCQLFASCRAELVQLSVNHWEYWAHSTGTFIVDALSRGGLAAYIYASHQEMLASVRGLRTAQLERARTEQRLSAMRLWTLQTRVDPQVLLDGLARVDELYEQAPAEADRHLDALIQDLRAMSTGAATAAAGPAR